MKILIAHNAYQLKGGEDRVVEAEAGLLKQYGHDVEIYRRHNDELNVMSKTSAALSTVWSRKSADEVAHYCRVFQPDLIHVHNTFPLISPSLFWVASANQVPVVQTLHNFRLLCPQATFLRQGKICEDCLGKPAWRSIPRKCYRDSEIQSAAITGMLAIHRTIGTYREKITRYIALNAFCRDKFVEGGLPAEKICIKPNFAVSDVPPGDCVRRGGLFVGRLSTEKGLDVLVAATPDQGQSEIEVIGSGPLEELAKAHFGERYSGFMSLEQIMQKMRSARFLVLPSICYESSPCTIAEAFSCGLPVITSRLGALAEIVEDGVTGLLFNPGSSTDLAKKIAWANANPQQMLQMGQAARREYETHYTPERNHQMLLEIYDDAIIAAKRSFYGS
ncbi:MAG: glycosyltransferase family 4 protein [Glaciimonas sp.]|nr:glycosyltransferase family 4 protein [Glaciimonas sp.]